MLNAMLIFALEGIRPLHKVILGPAQCQYETTCTQFAIEQLRRHHLPKAVWRTALRVIACNPLCKPIKKLKN